MKRNLLVSYKNFRGIVLTQEIMRYEGKLNSEQLKKALQDKFDCEVHSVIGWSTYEHNEDIGLFPEEVVDFLCCIQELRSNSYIIVRTGDDGLLTEYGSVCMKYNIVNGEVEIFQVLLNGVESEGLKDSAQKILRVENK